MDFVCCWEKEEAETVFRLGSNCPDSLKAKVESLASAALPALVLKPNGSALSLKQISQPAEQEYGLLAEVGEAVSLSRRETATAFCGRYLPADGLRINFDLALGLVEPLGLLLPGQWRVGSRVPAESLHRSCLD